MRKRTDADSATRPTVRTLTDADSATKCLDTARKPLRHHVFGSSCSVVLTRCRALLAVLRVCCHVTWQGLCASQIQRSQLGSRVRRGHAAVHSVTACDNACTFDYFLKPFPRHVTESCPSLTTADADRAARGVFDCCTAGPFCYEACLTLRSVSFASVLAAARRRGVWFAVATFPVDFQVPDPPTPLRCVQGVVS